jgi:hypothetical protein
MKQSQYQNMRVARVHFQKLSFGYPHQVVAFEKLEMQILNKEKLECKNQLQPKFYLASFVEKR